MSGDLRLRAALVFTALALVLTGGASAAVWLSVSSFLLSQREEAAVAQAVAHAGRLADELSRGGSSPAQLLAELPRELSSGSLYRTPGGEWSTSVLSVGREAVPGALREAAVSGRAVSQRILPEGEPPRLLVGVPVPGHGTYFAVYPLAELDRTLRTLGAVLALAVAVIPVGTFLAGWWAMRTALRPLEHVAAAARAMAAGDTRARIDPQGDSALTSIARSFNDTAARLDRRRRADARFAADVSHELRTPLTTMLGAADHLERHSTALPSDGREILRLLQTEVARFARLVEDLLEMSRADAGSGGVVLETVRPAELVTHLLPSSLHGRLVITPRGAAAHARVDKRRLERALSNLVDNAERHGRGLDRLTLDSDQDVVCFVVEDAGSGLAEDDLDRVFDRFARGRDTGRGSTGGAGLGLALVARYAALMGGTVRAENRPAGGARFVLVVPRVGEPT